MTANPAILLEVDPNCLDTCADTRWDGDASKVRADQLQRIADVLAHLDTALDPVDDLPGYRLHPLKGDRKGYWSVSISGNWRIVFRFEDGDVFDVDLVRLPLD